MELRIFLPEEIGDRIRGLRRATGLSQYELGTTAFGTDLKRGTIEVMVNRIEKGGESDTSFQRLVALASAFAKLTEFSQQDVLDYFEGRIESLTLEVRPTLRAIEGEGKPEWGVPRRAPKKKAASQDGIACFALRPSEQPILCESAA